MSVKFWGPATLRSFKRVAKVPHKILKVWICLKFIISVKRTNSMIVGLNLYTKSHRWGVLLYLPPPKLATLLNNDNNNYSASQQKKGKKQMKHQIERKYQ